MAFLPGFTVPFRVVPSHFSSRVTAVCRSGLGPHSPTQSPLNGSLDDGWSLDAGADEQETRIPRIAIRQNMRFI